MIVYYTKRGDKHHARATFENMRARGIEPNAFVFTRQVHVSCYLHFLGQFFPMHAPACLPARPCHATPLLQHHCSVLPALIISVSKCVLLNLTVATTVSAPVLAILCVTHLSHKFALLCIELASKHCIVRVSLGFTVFILSDVEFVSLCMPILLASVHHCWFW